MNILIVTPELPWPPESGGKASQFATLHALQGDHFFRIVLTRDIENLHVLAEELEQRLPHVQVIRRKPALVQPAPSLVGKHSIKRVLTRFKNWIRQRFNPTTRLLTPSKPTRAYYPFVPLSSGCMAGIFQELNWADLIQAEFHEGLFTAFLPLGKIPLLFVCHQAHALFCERFAEAPTTPKAVGKLLPDQALRSWIQDSDAQAARILETTLLKRFSRVITFTSEDRQSLLAGDSSLHVEVSPFPIPPDIQAISPQQVRCWQQRLVLIGPGHWHPNVDAVWWFCREVRPLLLERFPISQCSLHVIGLWSQPLRESLNGHGVEFHGYVENPAETVAGCIALNPVFTGAGLRTKILLAAACSAVVVSTEVGCEGTGFKSGEHCLLANTGPEFADAIGQLLSSSSLCSSLASSAFEHLMNTFNANAVRQRRNEIYQSLQIEMGVS